MTFTPGCISPSITYSAFAIAFSFIEIQGVNSTGALRIAPAMESSLYPSGVVGGSKQDPTDLLRLK